MVIKASEGTCRDWFEYLSCRGSHFPLWTWVFLVVWATGTVLLHHYLDPEDRKTLYISKTMMDILGVGLFMVLAVRTNASMSRWWEARIKWGATINRTRDLAAQAHFYVKDEALSSCIVRHVVAFPYAMKRHLRYEHGLPELRKRDLVPQEVRLRRTEVERVEAARHMPLLILNVIRACVKEAIKHNVIGDLQSYALDKNVTSLEDQLGGCERILKTPFPFGYVVHLRVFSLIWLMLTPFAVLEHYDAGALIICAASSFAVLGLLNLGMEIEEPFGYDKNDLPLEAMCATIHANIAEMTEFPDLSIERIKADARSPDQYTTEDDEDDEDNDDDDEHESCLKM